jgi:hypothetical protein
MRLFFSTKCTSQQSGCHHRWSLLTLGTGYTPTIMQK